VATALDDLPCEYKREYAFCPKSGYNFIVNNCERTVRTSDMGWMAALILLSGALYACTLLPGLGGSGDTAKFQFVGKVLGTPHATGYPLYIALNYVFVHAVAIGSLAYRANLLSAVFATATLVVLYRMCRVLNAGPLASFTATAVFAVGPVFWSQALEAEVYTLHSFLMSLTILFLLMWTKDCAEAPATAGNVGIMRRSRHLLAACAVYALAFGNHMTSVMLLPSFAFIVFATDRRIVSNFRMIAAVLALIAAGAMQYGYLFWRYYSPDTPYLEMATPGLKEFIWYLRGAQFQKDMFAFPLSAVIQKHVPMFLALALEQFQLLLPFVVWGIVMLARDRRKAVFLLGYAIINALWALNYWIFDIEPYFIPTFLILAVCLAAGLSDVVGRAGKLVPAAVWWIMLLVPVKLAVANLPRVSERGNTETQVMIETALKDVKSNALIVSSDYIYSEYFWYFLIGEGMEKDRNIYLMNDFSTRKISDYLKGQGRIYFNEERRYAPAGLKVYCHVPIAGPERESGLYRVKMLEHSGLSVKRVTDQLVAVELPMLSDHLEPMHDK
jgi:hypothetical protein